MTDANLNTAPSQPDDNEPRDVLDFIDEAVGEISDADVEERLRDTLDRAGYCQVPALKVVIGRDDITEAMICEVVTSMQHSRKETQARQLFQQAREEMRAAREARVHAEEILAEARMQAAVVRAEAAKTLGEAQTIVRDARGQAERIIANARKDAEQIAAISPTDAGSHEFAISHLSGRGPIAYVGHVQRTSGKTRAARRMHVWRVPGAEGERLGRDSSRQLRHIEDLIARLQDVDRQLALPRWAVPPRTEEADPR
jgi:hypothetical protein